MKPTSMDKAVILARGLGKRMRRADSDASLDGRQQAVAETGIKALIPIGRPFLDYVLSGLADAGYRRVCLVVAPDHEVIRRYYQEEIRPERVSIEFAVQPEPRGTADAVAAAEVFAGADPFLVVNSDNYYPVDAVGGLRELDGMGVALFEQEAMFAGSNISADRIRQFAVGRISTAGLLEKILGKARRQRVGRASASPLAEHELLAFRPADLRGLPQNFALAARGTGDYRRRAVRPRQARSAFSSADNPPSRAGYDQPQRRSHDRSQAGGRGREVVIAVLGRSRHGRVKLGSASTAQFLAQTGNFGLCDASRLGFGLALHRR